MQLRTSVALIILLTLAPAQIVTLPPQPVIPGATIQVTLFNNTSGVLGVWDIPFWLQHADGGAATYPWSSDTIFLLHPGLTTTVPYVVPSLGPGSSGSFVFRWNSAALRIDVGTPSVAFPAIHSNPADIINPVRGHAYFAWWSSGWEVSNSSGVPHTFGPGDYIKVFSPGGTVPVASSSLSGLTVPPRNSLPVSLPISGLTPGVYTVETGWLDPATGSSVVTHHGIHDSVHCDLHLPYGHVIPAGGALRADMAMDGFWYPTAPSYAFCIGVSPGSTVMPNGSFFPLAIDAAVTASLQNGIGGLLINNVGVAPPITMVLGSTTATGILVTHPGLPALSGMTVRAAAIAYDLASGNYAPSQGEDLVIQ